MSMKHTEVQGVLTPLGFVLEGSSGFGHEYALPLGDTWKITAYGSLEGNAFAGTADPNIIKEVSFTLASKGTKYICTSLAALKKHVASIIKQLTYLSQHEDLLRCPKCKKRFVHVKMPLPGQKWKPFLSCDGMMISGRGTNKGVECDGTSKKLPAVVKY